MYWKLLSAVITASIACSLVVFGQTVTASELDNLEPGHWYEVPNSKLRSVAPDPLPRGNIENVIEAWSGGAFDSRRNRLLVWGGGHADYSGNEIFAFDLDTLRWDRVTEPSLDVGGEPQSGLYPDGKPRSRHTYDYIEYLPDQDLFCSFGGAALYPSGNSGTLRTDCFDFSAAQWVQRATIPGLGGNKLESVSAYDYSSKRFYFKPKSTSSMGRYDPARDRWKEVGTKFYLRGKRAAEIDSKRGVLVIVGDGDTELVDLGSGTLLSGSVSGRQPEGPAPGLAYDLVSERVIGWAGGADVFSLDTASRTWTTHAPADSNSVIPPKPTRWGTYGRFRYVPSRNLFVVVNSVDQNVFVYRLTPDDELRAEETNQYRSQSPNAESLSP